LFATFSRYSKARVGGRWVGCVLHDKRDDRKLQNVLAAKNKFPADLNNLTDCIQFAYGNKIKLVNLVYM
jgi:hypothetical protein